MPGATRPLAVAALAVVHEDRFGRDLVADRAAGAATGISVAHFSLSPVKKRRWIACRVSRRRGTDSGCPARGRSVLLVGDSADARDDLLPTIAHGLEGGLVPWHDKAGMDEAEACSVLRPGERPGDDCIQQRAVPRVRLVPALPAVDEALVRDHLQHLAMNDAVPRAAGFGLERKALALHRLEPGRRHQPAADQFAGRQCL